MIPFLAPLLHDGAQISWTGFSVHWSTVIGLALFGALYEWRARQGRRASGATVSAGQRALFFTGIAVMFLSLNGPLHDLSDYYLFSAHMVQHLLLTLVVAPLYVMGTPGWMLRPMLDWPLVGAAMRWLTRPAVCFLSYVVCIAAWHLPPLYNLAMAHHNVHIVEHLLFIATAVMMWWPIVSPMPELPRLSYPMQMLYLFLMSIPMSIVAVYITYADSVLYPAYASAPRIWGLSPMDDQLLGGLIMWIPGGLFLYAIISVIFFRWQQRDGVETTAGAQVDWTPPAEALAKP
jgi:putative membrane protein